MTKQSLCVVCKHWTEMKNRLSRGMNSEIICSIIFELVDCH